MTYSEVDHDKADPTMTERLHQMKPIGVIIGYGIVATMILPLLALKQMSVASYCVLLATLLAIGLAGAGLWGARTLLMRDPVTEEPVHDYKRQAGVYLLMSLIMAGMTFLGTWFATWASSNSWVSYTILKSGGLLTYILFGGIPVMLYILSVYAVASRKMNTSRNWSMITGLILIPASIWAQMVWVGFKVYSDYHVI